MNQEKIELIQKLYRLEDIKDEYEHEIFEINLRVDEVKQEIAQIKDALYPS